MKTGTMPETGRVANPVAQPSGKSEFGRVSRRGEERADRRIPKCKASDRNRPCFYPSRLCSSLARLWSENDVVAKETAISVPSMRSTVHCSGQLCPVSSSEIAPRSNFFKMGEQPGGRRFRRRSHDSTLRATCRWRIPIVTNAGFSNAIPRRRHEPVSSVRETCSEKKSRRYCRAKRRR